MTAPLVHCRWTLQEADEVIAALDPLSPSPTLRRAREWLLAETLELRENLRRRDAQMSARSSPAGRVAPGRGPSVEEKHPHLPAGSPPRGRATTAPSL